MSRAQLITLSGAAVLFVLLLFAKTKPAKTDKISPAAVNSGASFESMITDATESLSGDVRSRIGTWNKDFDHATRDQKLSFLDSLCMTWDKLKRPEIGAWYYEQKAIIAENKADFWNKAGEHYFKALRFVKKDKQTLLYQSAIRCFEKTLKLDPENLNAKTNLGSCYVESSTDPMKGIGLLREVVAKDSNYIDAQLSLAFFSVKSGQYEKAVERFIKVLTIDPGYVEAYLFLADVYEKTDQKQKAIETLEKYEGLIEDQTIKTEVKNYIEKLKKS